MRNQKLKIDLFLTQNRVPFESVHSLLPLPQIGLSPPSFSSEFFYWVRVTTVQTFEVYLSISVNIEITFLFTRVATGEGLSVGAGVTEGDSKTSSYFLGWIICLMAAISKFSVLMRPPSNLKVTFFINLLLIVLFLDFLNRFNPRYNRLACSGSMVQLRLSLLLLFILPALPSGKQFSELSELLSIKSKILNRFWFERREECLVEL